MQIIFALDKDVPEEKVKMLKDLNNKYTRFLEIQKIADIRDCVFTFKNLSQDEDKLKKNFLLLIFMVLGLLTVILLSNVVFSIDIIHQDRTIRELLKDELKRNGINYLVWDRWTIEKGIDYV